MKETGKSGVFPNGARAWTCLHGHDRASEESKGIITLHYLRFCDIIHVMELFERIIAFFRDRYNKMTGEAKHRFALVCTAVFVVMLTLSVIVSMRKSASENRPLQPERPRINLAIPAEEFFLPDEPDFLPGVLLERERRTSWTEQDAVEYWQDPLRSGEEQWREKIETAVDEFLERIP